MVFTRFSGCTDSHTHSRMNRPNYRMPPALFFNGDEGIKIILTIKDDVLKTYPESRRLGTRPSVMATVIILT